MWKDRDALECHSHGWNIISAKNWSKFKIGDATYESNGRVCVNNTTHVRTNLIDLAVNGKFIRHFVMAPKTWTLAIKIYAPDVGRPGKKDPTFLFAPASNEHLIAPGNAGTHMPKNPLNQSLHCHDAAGECHFFSKLL